MFSSSYWKVLLIKFTLIFSGIKHLHSSADVISGFGESAAVANSGKLAVMILFPHEIANENGKVHFNNLQCVLTKLYANIGHHTYLDVFLWMREEDALQAVKSFRTQFPYLNILKLCNLSGWSNLSSLPYNETASEIQSIHWKLSYAFDFVRSRGYQFVMHLEDDAYITQPIETNIVEAFGSYGKVLAMRDKQTLRRSGDLKGLVERALGWLKQHHNATQISGSLLDHMYSIDWKASTGSWDGLEYQSNMWIAHVDNWFEPQIQKFIDYMLAAEERDLEIWNLQGILSMLRLLFIPEHMVYYFPQNQLLYDTITDNRHWKYLGCMAEYTDLPLARLVTPDTAGGALYNTPAVRVIEFPLVRETVTPEIALRERVKELFLFHWVFNPDRCGQDTATLNMYSWYLEEAERRYLRTNMWWHRNRVDELLERLLLSAPPESGTTTTDEESRNSSSRNSLREHCAEVLRQQLALYVEFYLAFGFQGRPMQAYHSSVLAGAMAQLNKELGIDSTV